MYMYTCVRICMYAQLHTYTHTNITIYVYMYAYLRALLLLSPPRDDATKINMHAREHQRTKTHSSTFK